MYREVKTFWAALALIALPIMANATDVKNLRLVGPYPTNKPFMTDSLDSEGNRIDLDNVLMDAFAKTDIMEKQTIRRRGCPSSNR